MLGHCQERTVLTSKERDPFRWYDPILLWIVPPLAALLIKLMMLSCRVVKVEGMEKEKETVSRSGGGAVYATWHQRMSYHFHYFGARHVIIMISQSRDGSRWEAPAASPARPTC